MVKHFSRAKKESSETESWYAAMGDSKSTEFIQMMILGWLLSFVRYGQICVLVAVATLEEVVWYLQICNSCFCYQMNKLWPMSLLLFEPAHVITYNNIYVTSKDSDKPVHPPSNTRVSFVPLWIARRLQKAHAFSEEFDQTAQADLSFACRTSLIVGFVVRRLIYQILWNVKEH